MQQFKLLDTVHFGFGEGVIVKVGGPAATPVEIYSPTMGLVALSANQLTLVARSVTFTLASLEALELAINAFRITVAKLPQPNSNVFSVALAEFERIRSDADFGPPGEPAAPVDKAAVPLNAPQKGNAQKDEQQQHDDNLNRHP